MRKGKKKPGLAASAERSPERSSSFNALRPGEEPNGQTLLHELRVHQIELEVQNEELRAARGELEAALARHTELFDFAPVGYATLGPDRSILSVNHVAARLLERSRSLLQHRRFSSLVAAEYQDAFQELLAAAEATGERQCCELELTAPNSKRLPVRLDAQAVQGTETTLLLAFQDIAERKLREQRLAETERALRDADRRKNEFLGVLSHELRNPLAPIRNGLSVLARATPGSEAAKRAYVIIDRQVTQLTRLVDDLLDVTRIARGKIQLQLEQVELAALLRRTAEDQRSSFEASRVELELQLDLPCTWVRADSTRLVQIVSNVLTNSLKFTPPGGRVQLSLQHDGQQARLCISDNGVGIPEGVLEHVFEAFAQAPQTLDRSHGGLGLGLAMVKGLVELHGGSVQVESGGLGSGTQVTIGLPLCETGGVASEEQAPGSRTARSVLLIEDNLDAAETLQEALELNGHQVKVAHDGVEGLQLAEQFTPEVVLCDIGLPGMDGYAIARAFRAHPGLRETFLVALSGYAQPDDLERARIAGFNHHVAKPTNLNQLERLLAEAPRAVSNPPTSNPPTSNPPTSNPPTSSTPLSNLPPSNAPGVG